VKIKLTNQADTLQAGQITRSSAVGRRDTARCFVSLNMLLIKSFKVIRNGIVRKICYDFLYSPSITMALSCIISKIKRDI